LLILLHLYIVLCSTDIKPYQITTDAGTRFLVEVKPVDGIDQELFLKVGKAADFAEGILLVGESPFGNGDLMTHDSPPLDFSGLPKEWIPDDPYPTRMVVPNCIGLTSVFGPTTTDIFNLCTAPNDVRDRYDTEEEFCLPLWNQAVNLVQHLKPK
jgi:hypothetical protein